MCQLALNTNVNLADCGDKLANYISAVYRFIPSKIKKFIFIRKYPSNFLFFEVISNKNFSICDSGHINASISTVGVITSPNYPILQSNQNCQRKIIALPDKIIRIFLTDIKIETQYSNEYLLLNSNS